MSYMVLHAGRETMWLCLHHWKWVSSQVIGIIGQLVGWLLGCMAHFSLKELQVLFHPLFYSYNPVRWLVRWRDSDWSKVTQWVLLAHWGFESGSQCWLQVLGGRLWKDALSDSPPCMYLLPLPLFPSFLPIHWTRESNLCNHRKVRGKQRKLLRFLTLAIACMPRWHEISICGVRYVSHGLELHSVLGILGIKAFSCYCFALIEGGSIQTFNLGKLSYLMLLIT